VSDADVEGERSVGVVFYLSLPGHWRRRWRQRTVTDLGFRCRGAEHLLLLLDTRKTSFIEKNLRGE
jgi:hypothetical protein